MSTERSRQRANMRDKLSKAPKKSKYHFLEVEEPVENEDWRGLVIPPKYIRSGPKLISQAGSALTLQEIKSYMLYWERIAIPKVSKSVIWPDLYDFASYGHNRTMSSITRDHLLAFSVRGKNPDVHNVGMENQLQVFHILEKRDPGKWAIAESGKNQGIRLNPDLGRSLLVRLHGAIPVPRAEIELVEVLEFKQRHVTELREFRYHLDALFLKIVSSSDTSLAFKSEFDNLAACIADLVNGMERQRIGFRFAGVVAKLKWIFDPKSLAPGGVALALTNLETALMVGAAGLASNLIPRIDIESTTGLIPTKEKHPLRYALNISRDLV